MKFLSGGRQGEIIYRKGRVHRPSGFWTKQVHTLLSYLQNRGLTIVPEPFGFDGQGREILGFLKGEVKNYPLPPEALTIKTLTSSARLLRKYHDASEGYLSDHSTDPTAWQLPCRNPQEVVCHSDFAPYNVVLEGEEATGIIDFDTCHPGPRVWDIAYALYRWSPFTNPHNKDGFGAIEDQIRRACLFCKAYGLSRKNRRNLADLMIERLECLVVFMLSKAAEGNKTCALNIKEGHHLLYQADIDYIRTHKSCINKALAYKD